ncbi:phosphatidylinositol-binding protein scs2 [Myotisia sp. PD_48]|nr:phosphatidylinositol-binding protein scs2 [Myotisia sp. PD_48]
MSVDLEPAELTFRRPFNREVSQVLHLRNFNNDPIAFKVKTTAPKHYCVRPNSGRIEPGKHMEVQVLLQAMKSEPPLDAKCRDKFLVQSVAVPADKDFSSVSSIWQDVEKKSKSQIQERKIRVVYLPPEGPQQDTEGDRTHAEEDQSPPAYTSPNGAKYDTPAADRTLPIVDERTPQAPMLSEPTKNDRTSKISFEDNKPSTNSTVPDSPGNPPSPENDLSSQLAEARAQIQSLKQQVSQKQNELRQRKTPAHEDEKFPSLPSGSLKQQQAPLPVAEGGVPLKAVAGLCLLSFLLAYIFF